MAGESAQNWAAGMAAGLIGRQASYRSQSRTVR